MEQPILLTKTELIKPISEAISRIESIKSHIENHQETIIIEGFFVLAIASFETSIIDTLKILFKHIPAKLNAKTINISKDDLMNRNPLELAIESSMQSLSYKNVNEIINSATEYLSIDIIISENEINTLQENKARRNLLIHNNLKTNGIYEDTAGTLKSVDNELSISVDYLNNCIKVSLLILTKFKNSISEKFKNYTKIRALKILFNYCFSTPIMIFENEWIIDEKNDVILGYNSKKSERSGLSSSEQTLFSFWHIHLCGLDSKKDNLNFWTLSDKNRQKVSYLLSILNIFQT